MPANEFGDTANIVQSARWIIAQYKDQPRAMRKMSQDMKTLSNFFRMKSDLLRKLPLETLLDVIQHCEFVTVQEDDLIIHQGEKGHRFYICLRGNVSVLHKDSLEDVDLGDEGDPRSVDRSTLGNELVRLGEGATFGEIALINPDCIRTASIVANEKTDLVVIHRDLYNRSVSNVIAREYAEKMSFIDSVPLFADWSVKWKKHLAASLRKESFLFDSPIFRQGDKSESMYFIISGEVKLLVDPEAHQQQFAKLMHKYGDICDVENMMAGDSAYFPQKLLPQIEKFSRVNKSQLLQRSGASSSEEKSEEDHLPQSWSPSTIRRMNAQIKSKKVSINLCYLGDRQYFGDVEFLLGLDIHHSSAICSRETVVMSLYRSHFERLFKRRNPKTLRRMAETAELQLTRRIIRPNIVEFLPLLKCFVYKMQEVKREAGKKFFMNSLRVEEEQIFNLPNVCFEGYQVRPKNAVYKAYTWSDATKLDASVPFKPRSISYSNTHNHTPLERKSKDPNKNSLDRVGTPAKRQKSVPAYSSKHIYVEPCRRSPAQTHRSADSWYSNKSFLPGIRHKTRSALSQSSGYYSEASNPAPVTHRTNGIPVCGHSSHDAKAQHISSRCGTVVLKVPPRYATTALTLNP